MSKTERYRPGNGTEGDIFMSAFCFKCRHDTEDKPCEIIGRTMGFDINAPEYPAEWVRDRDDNEWPGTARCTAFEPPGDDGTIRDDRQEALL